MQTPAQGLQPHLTRDFYTFSITSSAWDRRTFISEIFEQLEEGAIQRTLSTGETTGSWIPVILQYSRMVSLDTSHP